MDNDATADNDAISLIFDGLPDRLDCDTLILESRKLFLQWSRIKRVKTQYGEALKLPPNHTITASSTKELAIIDSFLHSLSTLDPPLDMLFCHLEYTLSSLNTDVEGIFRINGECERVKSILKTGKVTAECTVHDVASALKQRLKEVGVLSREETNYLLSVGDGEPLEIENVKVKALRRLCKAVIREHPRTRMNADNLAVCLLPSIFDLGSVDGADHVKRLSAIVCKILK
jgi:hypothetical protein